MEAKRIRKNATRQIENIFSSATSCKVHSLGNNHIAQDCEVKYARQDLEDGYLRQDSENHYTVHVHSNLFYRIVTA